VTDTPPETDSPSVKWLRVLVVDEKRDSADTLAEMLNVFGYGGTNVAEDPPAYRRGSALQRAVDTHGQDTEEEYSTHSVMAALLLGLTLVPAAISAGAALGAIFTSGSLRWPLVGMSLLLAWPAVLGLAGFLYLFSKSGIVVLIYKDRLVWQRGSVFEVVRWDEVESLHIHTVRNSYKVNYEPPESAYRVHLETKAPIARYWREWIEIRAKDERVIRVPSSITDYEGLCQTVQQEVFGLLGPSAKARLDAGQPAQFGALVVWPDRVEHGGAAVAWDQHAETGPIGGQVTTTDKACRQVGPAIPVEEVPNLALALSLITDHSASQAATRFQKDEDED